MNKRMQGEIKINECDFDSIKPNNIDSDGSRIVIIGSSGSGKSTLIKHLLLSKRHIIPIASIFSGTEDSNKFFESFTAPLFIYDEYNESVIQKIINRQKAAMEALTNPWLALIIDDCTEDRKIFSAPVQQGLFKKGRHWKIFYILSLQHAGDVPQAIKTNVSGVFIFREDNENNLVSIYKNYAGVIPTFPEFKSLMRQITGDYTALYIDSSTQNVDNWQDRVYWVKADEKLCQDEYFGAPEYVECSSVRYNPNWSEIKRL